MNCKKKEELVIRIAKKCPFSNPISPSPVKCVSKTIYMNSSNLKLTVNSLHPPKIKELNRAELKAYFDNTWQLYEMLFSSIKDEATYYLSPDPLRNPLIFYWGHTAAFYINKCRLAGLLEEGVHPHWDQLFAIGVDPNLPENLETANTWPTIQQVNDYRQKIYNIIHQVIDDVDLNGPITQESSAWAILMGLEHDRIHFETSSVLIRQVDVSLLSRPKEWKYAPTLGSAPENEWIEVQGGSLDLGKPESSEIYGWDNEYGSLTVAVEPFKATKNLISNVEFLAFVQAGGYENRIFWTKEGWEWKTRTNTTHPKFWLTNNSDFGYRAMFDEMPMPMDWPAEVNAHETAAYIHWLGNDTRLMTEAEFLMIARAETSENDDPAFLNKHNLHFAFGSPTPLGFMKKGMTVTGFNDIYGNVWDWLQNDFYPLPGFKTHPWYKDFSAPYMDAEHGMMAGGSWATTGTGTSKYYRLWFRRHFFQHAGFRLAKSL